jgi:2-keto-4-pentenoate hydratase
MSGADELLDQLHEAGHSARAIAPLPPEALDKQQGYSLLRQGLAQRLAGGERLSGWKVAFAGRAAQARFGRAHVGHGGRAGQRGVVRAADPAQA